MKKITIEELARMVTKGFTEMKYEMSDLRREIKAVDNRLSDQIKGVDSRLSTIEFLLSSSRIDRLEDSVRHVKAILKIK